MAKNKQQQQKKPNRTPKSAGPREEAPISRYQAALPGHQRVVIHQGHCDGRLWMARDLTQTLLMHKCPVCLCQIIPEKAARPEIQVLVRPSDVLGRAASAAPWWSPSCGVTMRL